MEKSPSLWNIDPNYCAIRRIEWLLEQARSKKYTRRRRRLFRKEAEALTLGLVNS